MTTDKDGKQWVWVPEHYTLPMRDACAAQQEEEFGKRAMSLAVWDAMLAAAPAFEPGEELVEEVARAIFEAWAKYTASDATWDEIVAANGRPEYPRLSHVFEMATAEARAAISAMIGRKG